MQQDKDSQHNKKEVLDPLVVVPAVAQGGGGRKHLDYDTLKEQRQRCDHSEYGQVLLCVADTGYEGDYGRELKVHYHLHERKRCPELKEFRECQPLFHNQRYSIPTQTVCL